MDEMQKVWWENDMMYVLEGQPETMQVNSFIYEIGVTSESERIASASQLASHPRIHCRFPRILNEPPVLL